MPRYESMALTLSGMASATGEVEIDFPRKEPAARALPLTRPVTKLMPLGCAPRRDATTWPPKIRSARLEEIDSRNVTDIVALVVVEADRSQVPAFATWLTPTNVACERNLFILSKVDS